MIIEGYSAKKDAREVDNKIILKSEIANQNHGANHPLAQGFNPILVINIGTKERAF